MKPVLKKIWYGILLLLLIFVVTQLDVRALLSSLSAIPLIIFALMIALQVVSQLLVNLQWYKVAKFSDAKISFRNMFHINCQGAVIDSITPGVKVGGEVTRAVQISRIGNCSGEQAAAVVAVQKLFSLSAFFFINLFAVGFILSDIPSLQTGGLHFVVYGVLILFLLLFAFLLIFPQKALHFFTRNNDVPRKKVLTKLRKFVKTMLCGLLHLRQTSKTWVLLLVLSFFIWILYPLKMYLITMHMYPGTSFVFLGAVTFIAYMVAMIPIFPGGIGGFEGTMAGLFIAGGFASSDAVAIAIAFRFFTFWLVMLMSLGFLGVEKIFKTGRTLPN